MLVYPRARLFCCEHGFAKWTTHVEFWYKEWTNGGVLADGIRKCADGDGFHAITRGRVLLAIRLVEPGMEMFFEVIPCPEMLDAVCAVQRLFRRRLAERRRERLVAAAMGWHARLGRECGLGKLHADVLGVIAQWV